MSDDTLEIRKPAVAGSFYLAGQVDLIKQVAGLFSEVSIKPIGGRPMALIAPHAGYAYSGKTAAKAFKLLQGEQYDTVVVVSPSHTVFFQGSSVFSGHGYQTPIGVVEIDRELSDKIANIHPLVYTSKMGHATGGTRGEHALEVQLPFLQTVLGNFKLVAIVMGDQESDSVSALGEVLASALGGTNTLLVASSDLSHFHRQKQAERLDSNIREAISQFDPTALMDIVDSGKGEACGAGPMAAVMAAARRLGGGAAEVLEYTTSAETTGDFEEVVGYLSAVVTEGEKSKISKVSKADIGARPARGDELILTDEDREYIKQVARDAVMAHIENNKYEPPYRESLDVRRGVFVTLTMAGALRGCIGQIRARRPLYEAVAEMAVAAAFDDPRFDPLTPAEAETIDYEISVLSRLERVHDFKKIQIGRDGLMIKLDMNSGLLLPQVAADHKWEVSQFLEQTCLKAGLPRNSYKDPAAEVYKFSAEIF